MGHMVHPHIHLYQWLQDPPMQSVATSLKEDALTAMNAGFPMRQSPPCNCHDPCRLLRLYLPPATYVGISWWAGVRWAVLVDLPTLAKLTKALLRLLWTAKAYAGTFCRGGALMVTSAGFHTSKFLALDSHHIEALDLYIRNF